MDTLGTSMMLVCSSVSPHAIDDDARAAAQLQRLAERAARRNIRIGYEALAWASRVNRYAPCVEDRPRGRPPAPRRDPRQLPHPVARRRPRRRSPKFPGDKIFFLQMADAPRLSMDVLQWSRHYRNFPGQGQLDLAALPRAGAASPATRARCRSRSSTTSSARRRIARSPSTRCARCCTSRSRRACASRGSADRRSRPANERARTVHRIELFDPPAAPTLTGVAFLEFAVDEATEWLLGNVLEMLGFRRAGRHRSKNVTLYRQGSINLILNAEPDSFAREHFNVHGPSICAVSLTTDDAVARAKPRHRAALPAFRQPARAQRAERAGGARAGRQRHLLRRRTSSRRGRLYEIDFDLDDRRPRAPDDAGLLLIDHVAMGVPVDALDTWTLFYRAVLGLEPGESLELSRPVRAGAQHGCCERRSRGARGAERLAKPEHARWRARSRRRAGRASTTSRSRPTTSSTRWRSCAATARSSCRSRPTTTTTCARASTCRPSDVARMRELPHPVRAHGRRANILHAYSESFADRFFFEIVQRVGDYDGYGALNAAARLASQSQLPPPDRSLRRHRQSRRPQPVADDPPVVRTRARRGHRVRDGPGATGSFRRRRPVVSPGGRARAQCHGSVQARRVPICDDPHASARRRRARSIRSSSTGGSVIGDNTDGAGLVRDIRRSARFRSRRQARAADGRRAARRAASCCRCSRNGRRALRSPTERRPRRRRSRCSSRVTRPRSRSTAGPYAGFAGEAFDLVINATSASLPNEIPPLPQDVFAPARSPTTWCTASARGVPRVRARAWRRTRGRWPGHARRAGGGIFFPVARRAPGRPLPVLAALRATRCGSGRAKRAIMAQRLRCRGRR